MGEGAAVGGLDREALQALGRTVGDPSFVGELVGDFLSGAPVQVASLHAAIERADAGELRRVAHTLKANAATFGAGALSDACRDLENAADGEPDSWSGLVAAVEAELQRVRPALEAVARDPGP